MSKDLDALRQQFYADDSEDPFSSSTAVGPTPLEPAGAGPSRSRQNQGRRSSRAAPYPNRNNSGRASGGGRRFDDDPLGGLGLGRPPADVMDLDLDLDTDERRRRGDDEGGGVDIGTRREAALEIEREEMGGLTGETTGSDMQQLLCAWQAERHAPAILPAQGELLGRVLDAIRQQVCLYCYSHVF